ncbi:MAG: ABC transporter ATP-binding protein [FCB group bacterium]|nr:ABC transporter ATP-binding protein [FCB group bacterium]MBL7027538.1 ABC transporter ATP-binding protein [Candidatus Neomarinimicrobiota bacterium]MBL7121168.1 ABC transporter ATP-binding protein [Candidatus Neomarinimicrobiota bacterium]
MSCHIQVKNLALTYRWKTYQKVIFQDLNLCISSASFVTIIGGNGSGKSSLVKLILGLVKPDSGEVLLNDKIVRPGYPEAIKTNRLAYLTQQIEDLFFSETVAEELSYGGDGLGSPDMLDILQTLGLDTLMNRSVDSLSGGERQSLALAQFMLQDAPLLILDEPSSYLDQTKAALLKTFLVKAHQAGKTVIHVTQFTSELSWGTHVIDLDQSDVHLVAL